MLKKIGFALGWIGFAIMLVFFVMQWAEMKARVDTDKQIHDAALDEIVEAKIKSRDGASPRTDRADRSAWSKETTEKMTAAMLEQTEQIAELRTKLEAANKEIRVLTPVAAPELAPSKTRELLKKGSEIEATAVLADGSSVLVGATDQEVDLGGGFKVGRQNHRSPFVVRLAPTGEPQWSFAFGNESGGEQRAHAVATLSDGSCIVGGCFSPDTQFRDVSGTFATRQSNGGTDCFVVKYDAAGHYQWLQTFGGASVDDTVYAISVRADGGCFVAGRFGDVVQFGADSLTCNSTQNGFISRFDAIGKFLWTRQIKCAPNGVNAAALGVCTVDDDTAAIVVGKFYGYAGFGDGLPNLKGEDDEDAFVAKYSLDGIVLWAKAAGGKGVDGATAVTANPDGTVTVKGSLTGAADFWLGEDLKRRLSNSKAGVLQFAVVVKAEDGSIKSLDPLDAK